MERIRYELTTELTTGVQIVDKQHRELLREIDQLMDNLSMGYIESVRATLEFLQEYTIEHFGMEEKFMIRYSYPDFYQHRDEHSAYIKAIYDYKRRIKDHGVDDTLVGEIREKLGDWFVNHIRHTDMAFGDYLKSIEYAPQ